MFYKVVFVEPDGKRTSIFVGGGLLVEYPVGEWACAPEKAARAGYHPLVYDSVTAAIRHKIMTHNSHRVEVWECEVDGVVETLPPWGILNIISPKNAMLVGDSPPWPAHTVMAKRVKLTKLVGQEV